MSMVNFVTKSIHVINGFSNAVSPLVSQCVSTSFLGFLSPYSFLLTLAVNLLKIYFDIYQIINCSTRPVNKYLNYARLILDNLSVRPKIICHMTKIRQVR